MSRVGDFGIGEAYKRGAGGGTSGKDERLKRARTAALVYRNHSPILMASAMT